MSFIAENYLWTRGTEMMMNVKMDIEDQEDERNIEIPEGATELGHSKVVYIMDENTHQAIISKLIITCSELIIIIYYLVN